MKKKLRIIHMSSSRLGGAEKSVLESYANTEDKHDSLFLLPESGAFSKELDSRGISWKLHKPPAVLHGLSRLHPIDTLKKILGGCFQLCITSVSLYRVCKSGNAILSIGLVSHFQCALLAPFLKNRLSYNIRDFIKPLWLRKGLNFWAKTWQSGIIANSQAVAKDYYRSQVHYPPVTLAKPYLNRRNSNSLVVSNVGYFAPYKGQLEFVDYAYEISRVHPEAIFWMIGDVLYENPLYREYRRKVIERINEVGLTGSIRLWGAVQATDVQELLEQSHIVIHCTLEPEPYGRVIQEALLCGCEVWCQPQSGACEQLDFVEGGRCAHLLFGRRLRRVSHRLG